MSGWAGPGVRMCTAVCGAHPRADVRQGGEKGRTGRGWRWRGGVLRRAVRCSATSVQEGGGGFRAALESRDSVFSDLVTLSRSEEGQQAWEGVRGAVDGGAHAVADTVAGLEVFPGRGAPLSVLFYLGFFVLAGAILTRPSKS